MKIVINDATVLKVAIDSVGNLIQEGEFFINEEGISLKAMDPSQISMVSFKMPKEMFSTYEVNEGKRVGLDIRHLLNILSRGKRGEKTELSEENGKFVITFIGEKRKRTFKIPILDLNGGIQREPKIEYSHFIKIKADVFKEILKDAELLSTYLKLSIDENGFYVIVNGDNGDMKATYNKDSEEIGEIHADSEVHATFPLNYLKDITKASPNNELLEIYIETDKPLKIKYSIIGASATYYLAPRIDTE